MKDVFLRILRAVGGAAIKSAPVIAGAITSPTLGSVLSALATTVLGAVVAAEVPGVPGPAKKDAAMQSMAVASTGLVQLIEGSTGKKLRDDAKLAEAISAYVEATVALLNAFEILPAKTTAIPPTT